MRGDNIARAHVDRALAGAPRVRGDNEPGAGTGETRAGAPPRARGQRGSMRDSTSAVYVRFTPACAGTTRTSVEPRSSPAEHPRVRGDNGTRGSWPAQSVGAPPACAGTTRTASARRRPGAEHPRVRGDNELKKRENPLDGALPRARGQHVAPPYNGQAYRSTFACAGTTIRRSSSRDSQPEHSRVRGDNELRSGSGETRAGAPPRARGQRVALRDGHGRDRSTPACAGTTDVARAEPIGEGGAPPRARGQRSGVKDGPVPIRSTPRARGTTTAAATTAVETPEHPRVRGDNESL